MKYSSLFLFYEYFRTGRTLKTSRRLVFQDSPRLTNRTGDQDVNKARMAAHFFS